MIGLFLAPRAFGAAVREAFDVGEVGELERVFADGMEFADEPARELAHPRDDVERMRKRARNSAVMGWSMTPAFSPGRIWAGVSHGLSG